MILVTAFFVVGFSYFEMIAITLADDLMSKQTGCYILLYIAIYILPLKGLYTTCPIHPLTHKRDFYLEFTWIHTQIMHREELRVQYLAQEYCGMQTGGARNRNNNIPSSSSTSTSGLPPDHRYPSVIHQNLNQSSLGPKIHKSKDILNCFPQLLQYYTLPIIKYQPSGDPKCCSE